MKTTTLFFGAFVAAALLLSGCGKEQANRPLAEVKAEAAGLNADQLNKAIKNCEAEVAKLKPRVEEISGKIAALKLEDQLGEKATRLKEELGTVNSKLSSLGDQIKVYADAQKSAK